jgi:hypothetical protein
LDSKERKERNKMKVTVCKGCGNRMQAKDEQGNDACAICIGISLDSGIPIEVEIPDRVKCHYCGVEVKTTPNLPFLDSKRGTYYCGCRGWD